MWRGELVPEEIKSLASCRSVSSEAIIVDWRRQDFEAAPISSYCALARSYGSAAIWARRALSSSGESVKSSQ